MPNITEVYKKYTIPKVLQDHQLRVAAVGKQICDNFTMPVNTEAVVKALLIHDMANILKFDFKVMPELLEPEGIEYWKKVKKEFAKKYQTEDEHAATIMIAKELGMDDLILTCIESISFSKTKENLARKQLEPKICDVSDLRVGPRGVLSLSDRLEEGRQRYKDRPDKWVSDDWALEINKYCYEIESQVFENCKIKPTDITHESIAPILKQLKAYEI